MSLQEPQSRVLLVTVHFKATDGVLKLLHSLQRLREFSKVDVMIVDNASGEEHLSSIRGALAQIPNAELLESLTNRGYFGAARFGFDNYLAQGHGLPDWVIVCNHDVLIEDEGFVEKLLACDPAVAGVLGPKITLFSQAIEQNPFMKQRPGSWRRFTMRVYSAAYPLAVIWDWFSRRKRAFTRRIPTWISRPEKDNSRQPIYAAHGSFMIFSRTFFEAGGKLDGQLFLFGEEIAVAEICRELGLSVIYEPFLAVLHNEHQSVGNGMSRRMYSYHRAAVRHVLSKYLTS